MAGLRRVDGDAGECARLELVLLTDTERAYLEEEQRSGSPQWDLDPPQRDDYDTPPQYVLALKKYAQRAMVADRKRQTLRRLQTPSERTSPNTQNVTGPRAFQAIQSFVSGTRRR